MSEVESIRLPSRFDYSVHKQFSDTYLPMLDNMATKEVILEFSLVEYLDSSALGMMVLMQKKMFSKNIKVKIKGARGATDEILKMANMNKLFEFI
jgi:HptB-dependent secretion and biofilm anti anti-sigma factor